MNKSENKIAKSAMKAEFSAKMGSPVLKDIKDERDLIFAPAKAGSVPIRFLNTNIAEIENQSVTSSCVANAAVSSLEMMHRPLEPVNLSRLFVYYNLRKDYYYLDGKDEGSYTRDAYKYINKLGVCDESHWPFINAEVNTKPSDEAYELAMSKKVLTYQRIYKYIDDVKRAILNQQGIIMSMNLGENFYYIRGPLAEQDYGSVNASNPSIGGHAMSIVGYDDELGGFIIENSWGPYWGDGGLFLLKYDVFFADVMDIWTATSIDFGYNIPEVVEPEPEVVEPEPEIEPEPKRIHPFFDWLCKILNIIKYCDKHSTN